MLNNLKALERMAVFDAVVECGSFSAAAARLGMVKSAVSRHVSLLEEQLGVRLLARTTRRLALTDAGREFHRRCARMVAEAAAAVDAVSGHNQTPVGTLKISAPQQLGQQQVAPALVAFHQLHPQLEIDLQLDDSYVDLVADNIDVAVRVGTLPDSSLVARKLADTSAAICASPAYLAARGEPKDHTSLAGHAWIIYTLARAPHRVVLQKPKGGRTTVRLSGPIRTNSGNAAQALVRAGAGLAVMPRFYVEDDLRSGALRAILPRYTAQVGAIYAVYLPTPAVEPRIRLFVDFLAEWFARACDERAKPKRRGSTRARG
jgi:DNA-binding transcriptional LysR family regulator